MNNNYALIMAGGAGTRLWPLSRQNNPKQFHDLLGIGKTLIQLTFDRLTAVCPKENIYVISNEAYEGLIREQLPQLSQDQILLEPYLRNTAPCIAYAAHKIGKKNPEANLIVAPADHLIIDQNKFQALAQQALTVAEQSAILITFGIQPTRPDTGYGYIHYDKNKTLTAKQAGKDIYGVNAFTEKPDEPTANKFLELGNYVWNSGIFVWNITTILNSFEQLLPEVNNRFKQVEDFYYTEEEGGKIRHIYEECPNISVDYGIMEKADNVYVIPADFGWTDLGSWRAVDEHMDKDDDQNHLEGHVFTKDTHHTTVKIPGNKLAVIQGLENYFVIESDNVLYIGQKPKDQEVKNFLAKVKAQGLDQFI